MTASATCPQCGHGNPAAQKFCGECGAALAAASDEPRFRSPQAYTPKHLAERILTSKAAVEGERKHVTVLLADLKGSTELLADRDPEEARKKMLELRAAISLARLWRDAGRGADALPLLAEVHGRFDEGFDTHDLRAARALLDELRKIAGRPV